MRHNVTYTGIRTPRGTLVTRDGNAFDDKTNLRKHSSTGFDWGLESGGSAQLALAMLCDFLGDDRKALEYYQEFKSDMIAPIGRDQWQIKSEAIVNWMRTRLRETRDASKGPVF